MSLRITLEIGHEAAIRTKRTPEGFTHDWELFVRGINADIHYYVEKVVFNLHDTFLKPRRVVKEPPYTVKESGYAGFNLPIEIYLKNAGEPKKITFNYDLHLQQSGPPIIKVQTERYLFSNISDEFRHRLLKGGATVVNASSNVTDGSRESSAVFEDRGQLVGKPKLGGDVKKHKRLDEPKNSFAELFGTPITKEKILPDPKNRPKTSPKPIEPKLDKNLITSKSKHSPHKDKDKSRDRGHEKKNKDDKHVKSKSKERDHSKDKSSKREKSPKRRSPSPKRSPKRDESPKKISSPKRIVSPISKPKIEDYIKHDEAKDRVKIDSVKSEKKPKKDKRDRDKDRDREHKKEHKSHKEPKSDALDPKKSKVSSSKNPEDVIKDKEQIKVKEKPIIKPPEPPIKEVEIKPEKIKSEKNDSEKHRYKHKKRDKEKSKKDEKERKEERRHEKKDKVEIAEAVKSISKETTPKRPPELEKDIGYTKNQNEFQSNIVDTKEKSVESASVPVIPISDDDSSDSSSIAGDSKARISRNDTVDSKLIEKEVDSSIVNGKDKKIDVSDKPEKIKKSKKHKDKSKNEKSADKDTEKKRKRKSSGKNKEEVVAEKVVEEERPAKVSKNEKIEAETPTETPEVELQTSPDYMSILRDLQRKIMTLQDNNELQQVVQLIAATGRYEITNQTFDFDLCALDRGTVKRLQDFFATT